MAQLVTIKLRSNLNAQRRRKRLLDRPSTPQSRAYSPCFYSDDIGPFINSHGLRLKRESVGAPFVSGLLFVSSPFAVFREVAFVIINSLNTVFRAWPLSHISQKAIKGIKPPLTNRDSAPTIPFVIRSILVVAPLLYVSPRVYLTLKYIKTITGMAASLKRSDFSVQARGGNDFSNPTKTKTLDVCNSTTSKRMSSSCKLPKNCPDRCVNLLSSLHGLSPLKIVCGEARQLFSQLFEPPYYTISLSRLSKGLPA